MKGFKTIPTTPDGELDSIALLTSIAEQVGGVPGLIKENSEIFGITKEEIEEIDKKIKNDVL